jgi:hypothetical protein
MYKAIIILIVLGIFLQGRTSSVAGREPDQPSLPEDFYETAVIITDRDLYMAGERLYFRLDLFSNANQPVSGIAYLVLRNRDNNQIENFSTRIDGNSAYGSIYLSDTLSSSVYQLVVFTNWMRNYGEECYATKEIVIINRFDESLSITRKSSFEMPHPEISTLPSQPAGLNTGLSVNTDSRISIKVNDSVFGTREKIQIEIVPSGPSGSSASLAISVAQKQLLMHDQAENPISAGRLNNNISNDQNNSQYFKETSGPVITGKVTDRNSQAGIPGATVIMTTPDTIVNLLYAITLADGSFHFRLNDYHEDKELYFSLPDRETGKNASISINDKFRLESTFRPGIDTGEALNAEFIKTSQDIARINKTLNINLNKFIERERNGYRPEVYSSPAWSFASFPEYEYLENMQEISRELLQYLRVRRQDDLYTSDLALQLNGTHILKSPVYFLDGIYTDDINRIFHLDSEALKKVEQHNYLWRHGNILFPGVIALFSKNQAYRGLKLSDPSISIENYPAADQSIYSPPDYEKDEIIRSRPDFRQLLYWEPELTVTNNGSSKYIEFYSGDLTGEFIVRAIGYTDKGEFISEEVPIIISHEPPRVTSRVATGSFNRPTHTAEPRLRVIPRPESGNVEHDNYKYFEQGLSGRVNLPPGQVIGSQHYPSEDWLLGDVYLRNGTIIRGKLLRYNGYMDELFWMFEGDFQQIQVEKEMVKEFRLNIQGQDKPKPVTFRKIVVTPPIYSGKELLRKDEIFGELLFEGNVGLYGYRRIIGVRTGEYWVEGKRYNGRIISPRPLYILMMPDSSSKVIRKINRRNILSLFPEKRIELRGILRENNIRYRDEQDLIEIAGILNSIF